MDDWLVYIPWRHKHSINPTHSYMYMCTVPYYMMIIWLVYIPCYKHSNTRHVYSASVFTHLLDNIYLNHAPTCFTRVIWTMLWSCLFCSLWWSSSIRCLSAINTAISSCALDTHTGSISAAGSSPESGVVILSSMATTFGLSGGRNSRDFDFTVDLTLLSSAELGLEYNGSLARCLMLAQSSQHRHC